MKIDAVFNWEQAAEQAMKLREYLAEAGNSDDARQILLHELRTTGDFDLAIQNAKQRLNPN